MSQYNIKLIEKIELAQNTLGFRFAKPKGFDFLPGQSVVLQVVPSPELKENFSKDTDAMRDMTIASSPTEDYLDFVVRQGKSDYKKVLASMQPDDEVVIFGPKGRFVFETTNQQIVMLAGGIGITPFISILKYINDKNLSQAVTLLYSNPTTDRIAYKNELDDLNKNSNIKVIYTLTKKTPENWNGETGRIDTAMIEKYVADIDKAVYYICGSTSMAEDTKRIVIGLGVKQENIKKEEFTGY